MLLPNRINKLQHLAPWAIIGLLLLAAALRFYRLENKNIWWDEGWSVSMARDPLIIMAERTAHDFTPPLYYALLHGWRTAVGDSEFALRTLSAFAGVLTVAATFQLGRALAGKNAGYLAALFTALARAGVWTSQDLRPYVFGALFATLSLSVAIAWLRRPTWKTAVLYLLVTAAGWWNGFFFVAVSFAQNLAFLGYWLFASPPRPPSPGAELRARRGAGGEVGVRLFGWLTLQLLTALLFLPWILYYLPRQPHWEGEFALPLNLLSVGHLFFSTLALGIVDRIEVWLPFTYAFVGLMIVGGVLAFRSGSARPRFGVLSLGFGLLGLWLAVWLVNTPLIGSSRHAPAPRYIATILPWFCILLAVAVATLRHYLQRISLILAGTIVILFSISTAVYYSDRYLSDDYKSVGLTLAAYRAPEDAVMLHNDRDWPIVAYHIGAGWIGVNSGQFITDDQVAAAYLEQAWQTHAGVWLLLTPESLVSDPDHRIFNWLMSHAKAMREFENGASARLFFFARTESRAATIDQLTRVGRPRETLSLSPAPGLTLTHADWSLPEYRVGETLHLFLYWRNANAPGLHSFALRLTTPQGQLAEEIPTTLEVTAQSPEMLRQQVNVPLRAYFGPGPYHLNLIAGETWADLGYLMLIPAQPHARVDGSPVHPTTAHFESGIELKGYTVSPFDEGVNLTLYWTTSAPVDRRYKMFVHLLGPAVNPSTGNPVWAQEDREPNLGGAPVTSWKVGETIVDFIPLKLPMNAPAGEYTAEVGWYDFFNGDRLLVLNDSGEVIDSRAVLGPFLIERAQ